jgi:predicted ATPase/DNA-binding winged helix-turn-helix (wHTH) protein
MKRFANFRLDISNACVWRDNTQLSLSPKPFAVLQYLVEHPGRLVTHDELLDALWPDTYVQPQVLRTYVLDLRKLLGDDAGDPRFIQTVPKRGYYFVARVEDCGDAGHAPIERVDRTAEGAQSSSARGPALVEIVGRESELERLGALLEGISNGQRQIVFVTGESGIGKTALVDAFQASDGIAQAALIVRGQCVEGLGRKEEYYPVMEALSQLCASKDSERACRILGRMAPAWLAVLGRQEESTSRATRRMTGELCEALEEFSQERPLVLVFEDLHWSDDATVHLISALARRRASSRLMVVATYRPYDVSHDQLSHDTVPHDRVSQDRAEQNLEHPLKGLKHDLAMRRLCAEIVLEPLAKTAVKQLLARELKQEALPSGLSSLIHQFSGGNPLFVLAILEHLISQGYLVRQVIDGVEQWGQCGTTAEMAANVPAGLTQMIELELERLGTEDRRLLEAGSLIDVAFPAWAVAAALEKDVEEAEEALDQLARRLPFVQRVGQDELPDGSRSAFYVFAHGIYREVLYQRQSASRLARRHIRVAVRLGELFAGRKANVAREMALHFEAGCDWQRAMHSLRTAADHAALRQAYAEAEQLLEHALRLAGNLPDDEARQEKHVIENELSNLLAGGRAGSFAGIGVKNTSRKS